MLSEEYIALLRIVYLEALHFPEIGQAFLNVGPERGIVRISQFLSAQMKAGVLKREDSQIAAEHFVALIQGQSMQRALLRFPQPYAQSDLDARIAKSVDFFLAIYVRQMRGKGE